MNNGASGQEVNQVVKGENAIKNLRKQVNKDKISQPLKKNWKEGNFDDLLNDEDNDSSKKQTERRQAPQSQMPLLQTPQQQIFSPANNPLSSLSFGGAKSNFVVGFSCQTNELAQPTTSINTNSPYPQQESKAKAAPYQKRTVQNALINQPLSITPKEEKKASPIELKDNSSTSLKSNKVSSPSISQEQNLLYDYSQSLKAKEQFEDLSNLIIEPKNESRSYNAKMQELNSEIAKMKSENYRVSQLREEYERLTQKLQKDNKEFTMKKEQDYAAFEAFKSEETKQLAKERKQLSIEQKALSESKVKMQTSAPTSKKDKDLIEQLRNQLAKAQEDFKLKDNTNKLLIDRLKKQLDEANNKVNDLNQQILKCKQPNPLPIQHNNYINSANQPSYANTQYQNKDTSSNPPSSSASRISKSKSKPTFDSARLNFTDQHPPQGSQTQKAQYNLTPQQGQQNKKATSYANIVKDSNSNNEDNTNQLEEEEDNYDMLFLDKYHNVDYALLKQETAQDGKVIRFYEKDKKEILFPSGVRKEIFNDGYQIVYFNNGDIKQMYPNGKSVYYFSEAKTIQTTFEDKQVFKFENGQIEQHYKDGTKRIAFPDGSLRYILPDGSEETYYLDGKIQKIDVNGVVTIEHENGTNEVKYPN